MANMFVSPLKDAPLDMPAVSNDFLPASQASGFFQNDIFFMMICLLAAVFVVFFVLLPLLRKIKRKQLKVKEISEIKKDLMIWRHLADLVRGGEEHQKAKRMLSDKIAVIRSLFDQGINLLSTHSRRLYELPWFVLVGEPRSGKSTLLRNSELEVLCASEEETSDDGDKKKLPFRMWLGAKAVVCDIGGTVFFDRWLNGSSAEWNYIVKLIRRKHYKHPLDGIIITIPADALMADKETLAQQKAMLMTSELGQLLTILGMYLPCYVVVTKLDMVNGFREYVMGMNDDIRTQIFGWFNQEKTAHYSESKFKEFWTNLIERLYAGCEKSMLVKNTAPKVTGRMDVTGKLYLFPENFNALYNNLSIYLRALFGEGNFHGADNAVLQGVFFTSSKDESISLSPSFASLCQKTIEEAPIVGTRQANERPYFIRDLLHKIIFKFSPNALFTRREQIRRHIPLYTVCLSMCVLGVLWISTAFFKEAALEKSLYSATEYYKSLNALLKNNLPFKSPLIKKNEKGEFVLNSDPLAGEKGLSRLQFFFEVFSQRETHIVAPFGFKLASFFVFGKEKDMGYADKSFITNQLFGIQIRMPVLKGVGEKLLTLGTADNLTNTKREAIRNFSLLDEVKNEDFTDLFTSSRFDFNPMLKYLLPSLSDDTLALLNCFEPEYDRRHTMTLDPAYIHSDEFLNALKVSLKTILLSWKENKAYPNEVYPKIKNALFTAKEISDIDNQLKILVGNISRIDSVEMLEKTVDEWRFLIQKQSDDVEKLKSLINEIGIVSGNLLKKTEDEKDDGKKIARNFIRSDLSGEFLLRTAYKNYQKRFNEDYSYVQKKISTYNGYDVWESQKAAVVIKNLKKEINKNLSAETELLEQNISNLSENPLFQWKFFEKGHSSGYMFLIANALGRHSIAIDIPEAEKLEKNSFETNWLNAQNDIKNALNDFDAFSKTLAEDQDFAKRIKSYQKMLLAQALLRRFVVLDDALKKLPSTIPEMMTWIEQKAENNTVFDVSPELWQEVAVNLSSLGSFDPDVVDQLLENVLVIAKPFLDKKVNNQQNLPNVTGLYRLYEERLNAFENYLADYIDYWGTFPEKSYSQIKTWDEFLSMAKSAQSHKINSLLQLVYMKSINVLKNIDTSLLSPDLERKKADFIALLTDRLNLLTTFFSEAGTKTLNAWAAMPTDPKKAWDKLLATSEPELKNSFMAARSEKKRGDIDWWNAFINNGISLLKDSEEQRIMADFQNSFDSIKAFPLCADCSKTLSLKKMRQTVELLFSMGAGASKKKNSASPTGSEKEMLSQKTMLFKDLNVQEWAENLYQLASTLSDEKKPLSWSISQPPADVQNILASKKLPAAVNRFRYIEVSVPQKRNVMRFSTALGKSTTIARGNAVDANLTLSFFKLSNDEKPEAKVVFKDFWSIFRLYLNKNAIYDPETKKNYIPVTVKDSMGSTYVYYLTLVFSKDIPAVSDWPRKKDWASFDREMFVFVEQE